MPLFSKKPPAHMPIDDLYNEAYALVEQGICYDEVGDCCNALSMYQRGFEVIEKAEKLPKKERNGNYEKMLRVKEQIVERLKDLTGSAAPSTAGPSGAPPAYDTVVKAIDAFGESKEVDEVFLIPFGVQLFMIENDDTTVPTYPEALKVFKFKDEGARLANASHPQTNYPNAKYFMQVGSWVYPLVPGKSPALHSDYGAYIFPNPTDDQPDLHVGVILPQDLDKDTLSAFKQLLCELTEMREHSIARELSHEEETRLSKKIAEFLVKSGEYIAWGVHKTAEKTGDYVHTHSQKYKEGPAGKEVAVDPRVHSSIHYLRKGTKVAVKVSGYLLDRIGDIGVHIGRKIAHSAESSTGGRKGSGIVRGTIDIIGGSVAGVATVWIGMEEAAKVLGKSLANDTVQVVHHRYGKDAAACTDNALYAAGHSTMTALNVKDLGIKGIAKRTASKAGLQVLRDLGGPSAEKKKLEPPTDTTTTATKTTSEKEKPPKYE